MFPDDHWYVKILRNEHSQKKVSTKNIWLTGFELLEYHHDDFVEGTSM